MKQTQRILPMRQSLFWVGTRTRCSLPWVQGRSWIWPEIWWINRTNRVGRTQETEARIQCGCAVWRIREAPRPQGSKDVGWGGMGGWGSKGKGLYPDSQRTLESGSRRFVFQEYHCSVGKHQTVVNCILYFPRSQESRCKSVWLWAQPFAKWACYFTEAEQGDI